MAVKKGSNPLLLLLKQAGGRGPGYPKTGCPLIAAMGSFRKLHGRNQHKKSVKMVYYWSKILAKVQILSYGQLFKVKKVGNVASFYGYTFTYYITSFFTLKSDCQKKNSNFGVNFRPVVVRVV